MIPLWKSPIKLPVELPVYLLGCGCQGPKYSLQGRESLFGGREVEHRLCNSSQLKVRTPTVDPII